MGIGDVVILERLQRPCRGLFLDHDRVRRLKYLVEIVGADKLLQDTDMGVVRLIQRKAFGERLEQPGVGIFGVLNHRRVGFECDVDRRHRILLREGSLGKRQSRYCRHARNQRAAIRAQ